MEGQGASESTIVAAGAGHTCCWRRSPHDSCGSLERSFSSYRRTHVDGCALFVFSALCHYAAREPLKRVLAMEVVSWTWHDRLRRLFGPLVRARSSLSSDMVYRFEED